MQKLINPPISEYTNAKNKESENPAKNNATTFEKSSSPKEYMCNSTAPLINDKSDTRRVLVEVGSISDIDKTDQAQTFRQVLKEFFPDKNPHNQMSSDVDE